MNARARLASILLLAIATSAIAQHPPAYPAKGQSPQQQSKDAGECSSWAQQQTGVNPAVASQPPPPSSSGPTGQRARGAVRGAAAGAVVGEVAHGDAGKGASTGAAVGVVAGGSRARREKRANEEAAKQGQQQAMGAYNSAWSACMKGRGYTVG